MNFEFNDRLKNNIINSIEQYHNQKLEAQFQSLIFNELLSENNGIPIVEYKKDEYRHDIFFNEKIYELKFQYECDLTSIINYYRDGTNKKIGSAIKNDIEISDIFILFILKRSEEFKKHDNIVVKEAYNRYWNDSKRYNGNETDDLIKEIEKDNKNNVEKSNKKNVKKIIINSPVKNKWVLDILIVS